ncbi:7-deoxyloganetic acid glucosyltransferase [Ananas comosus]|uniref:Glycosyltransferase n=1 Tax=Ananas comosus TaxID=4615 RepID=A0A199VN66_ANACO|nr:7-deoxyloganetic acid glucosyltransferase [Ananas comosus]
MTSDGHVTAAARAAASTHVLIFPFPAQGHLNCMLQLAELLAAADIHVTFLNTEYNHRRLLRSSSGNSLPGPGPGPSPKVHFRAIADGLPDDRARSAARLLELDASLRARSSHAYRDLLLDLREGSGGRAPRVTCVIADGIMPFAIDIAEELGIPAMAFRTPSASSVWAYYCIPKLLHSGELPIPEGADLDEPIRGVAGTESFLRRRDLPSFCREARSSDDPMLRFVAEVTAHSARARAFILNTCEHLEPSALSSIRARMPVTYAVGPLHALRSGSESAPARASLWREDRTCVAWLDGQPERSVVYVSFGSFAVMSRKQFLEFWRGLVGSGRRFLWVVRPDLIEEGGWTDEMESMIEGARDRDRARVVGWAPQREVLGHRAVGCFMTHSGWNSTLESMVEGVPMICWPFFADQQINSRFVSEVWRIGLDMKDTCERSTVERMVREAMEGDAADELRRSAKATAEAVRKSVEEGGSSFAAFQRLVQHIKSLARPN